MLDRIYCHIVWTTRDRQPLIDAGLARFLCGFLRAVATQENARILEIGPAAEAVAAPPVYGQGRAASLLAHYISAPMPKSFSRLAWSAAACTYLLIILGAIVRITGSGMGCGDHWPLCGGKLLPPLDLPTLIEYGHRLAAALVSVLVCGLAAFAWWLRRGAGSGERYFTSGAAYVALGLLIVQVLLGAVTVKLDLPPWTVILHLGTAMLLLATLIVAAQAPR